jgi:hypothetical protein
MSITTITNNQPVHTERSVTAANLLLDLPVGFRC